MWPKRERPQLPRLLTARADESVGMWAEATGLVPRRSSRIEGRALQKRVSSGRSGRLYV